jgi:hypothetical protein
VVANARFATRPSRCSAPICSRPGDRAAADSHKDLEVALALGWEEPHHLSIPILQERRIVGADDLERPVDRLPVLDDETIRPLLGMISAMRDYHRRRRSVDMREIEGSVIREVDQRKGWLEVAKAHAAEAIKRLGEVAKV